MLGRGLVPAPDFSHFVTLRRPSTSAPREGGSNLSKIRLGNRTIALPENQILRLAIGGLLVVGGLFGFLPVLGFWMLPLGFLVLATDIPVVRRMNRRVSVAVKRWWIGAKRGARSQSG